MTKILRAPGLIFISLFAFLSSCSSISKRDCTKNMHEFGLAHGRAGSPKNYLEDIRQKCSGDFPAIDLKAYQEGFEQGWAQFCVPIKGFEMGKKAETYISFCPPEREKIFRERFLLGTRHFELKDMEEELAEEVENLRTSANNDSAASGDYLKARTELEKLQREIQTIEVEGMKNTMNFR